MGDLLEDSPDSSTKFSESVSFSFRVFESHGDSGWLSVDVRHREGRLIQIWVKTPEVLARDRLLGSFSVKPVLNRVKYTLVGLAVSLVLCVLLFINIENSKEQSRIYGERSVAGVYKESSAKSFEPDAFHGDPDLS